MLDRGIKRAFRGVLRAWLRELLELPTLELSARATQVRLKLVEEDVRGLVDAKEATMVWSSRHQA